MTSRKQDYGLNLSMRGARGVITNLNAIAKALDATRLAATKTFQIDRQVRMLGVQAGNTARDISRLSMTTAGLAQATGVSIDKTTELITAYQATGHTIGQFVSTGGKVVEQFSAMNTEGAKNYRMMTELVGRFGISAKAAVRMERAIEHLAGPRAFGQLLDKTTEFQQKFKMPGMIAALPQVVNFAERSLTDFGHNVASNSQEIIYNTLQLGATYSKTFGVDAVEGINKAMEAQRRFLQQTRTDTNVFLGLASDFDPLTKALMETGIGLGQIQELTKLGQEDPIQYAQTIRSMFEQLGGDQSLYARRFLEQVRSNSSEAVKQLITNEGALQEAIRTRNEAAEDSSAVQDFEAMATSVRNIGGELLKTVSSLALLGRTVIGLTFVEDFADPISGAADALRRFNSFLRRTALQVKESKWFQEWKPRLQTLGKILLGLGAAAGVVASTFAGLIIPFNAAISAIRSIPVLGGVAGKGMDGLAASVISFGKGVLKPVGILAGLGTALNDFGKALKDPTISQRPFELLVRGLRAVSVGVIETFDNMLFGIPTTIAKWFYPEMRGSLGDAVKQLFTDLQLWFERGAADISGSWWDAFKITINDKVNQFYDYLLNNQDKFSEIARDWGKNIGRAIGTLTAWAVEKIAPLFEAKTWRGWFDQIGDFISGDAKTKMGDSFQGILTLMLGHGKTFLVSMIDEVLRPWGKGWIEVKQGFEIFWEYAKLGFSWFKNIGLPTVEQKWIGFKLTVIDVFYALRDAGKYAQATAGAYIDGMAAKIESAWHSAKIKYYELKIWAQESILSFSRSTNPEYLALGAAYAVSGSDAIARQMSNMVSGWEHNLGLVDDRERLRQTIAARDKADKAAFSSDTVIARAGREFRDDRSNSRSQMRRDYRDDYDRQNQLTRQLSTAPAEFAADKSATEARIRQIEERDLPQTEARDRERRRDIAQRRLDGTELQRIRPELIAPLDTMVNRLQQLVEGATGADARFRPRLERMLEGARAARRGVRNADTAKEATDRFNTYMKFLDTHHPGARERLAGEADTSRREYSAPPRVELEPAPSTSSASTSMGGDMARMDWGLSLGYQMPNRDQMNFSFDYAAFDAEDSKTTKDYSGFAGLGGTNGLSLNLTYKMELDNDDIYRAEDNRMIRIMPQFGF